MSILGPPDLPVVLKVPSDPIKFEVLSTLGHPVVMVELTEEQLEQAIRVTGDFIATYFPFEEKYAYFNTQPLVSEYQLPVDAYWVKDVKWDPATTRIGDIFGAESFLFCCGEGLVLSTKSGLKPMKKAKDVVTPYGIRKFRIKHHNELQYLVRVEYENGELICTPNQPIKVNSFDKSKSLNNWVNAAELREGQILITEIGTTKVKKVIPVPKGTTDSISCKVGCYFGCHSGVPILIR